MVRMNAVSEVYNFARFVADRAFHTCAAVSKANWRFAVEGNLLPTACKCPLWWGAGKPTGWGSRPLHSHDQLVFLLRKTAQALR